ncbi:catalase family peroxidase [Paraburkholderia pallida]|uniref:Catalase-related peroxidase n=1 Tax=Paraburkholderia pallida TaxID=2547399 RepID=A0A4P7D215_9BURK|nr:catalase family peroxidase [Paraburkholderia pallida]QBR01938.1 catalase family peroxidase [Paraburkholderia pallida]
MTDRPDSATNPVRSLILIAVVVLALIVAFAGTAGWLSSERLTPARLVDKMAPPGGAIPGFRRNHAKGICFTGRFESNGNAAALTKAPMFAAGSWQVTGRFNLSTPDPHTPDPAVRVRGFSIRVVTPGGSEWRSAMINAPFFAVSTPNALYELLSAAARKDDPDAMKAFAAAHPEFANYVAWASHAPYSASFSEDRYNSLNSFVFTNAAGRARTVRWSFLPTVPAETLSAEAIRKRAPDFLETDITERVRAAPQRWTMIVTVANSGDPTADPSKPWPDDRYTVNAGTLVVKAIEPEPGGPCRDINFDPTVLPSGISVSDDPFPSARSAAYSVSFNRRAAEDRYYPHAAEKGAEP